jgi:two-component system, NarL family, sensor histidine kinase UhpB
MGTDRHFHVWDDRTVGPRSLFWRLFAAYAAVGALAVSVLVVAPISVSVPTATREILVLLVGFAIALAVFLVILRRVLAPLERLTRLMRRVDPLVPGRRIEADGADAEVAALTAAFNDMLDRIESERRDSALRALAAQEAERRRIARELHDEIGQMLTGLVLRTETIARRAPPEVRADLESVRETARRGAEDVRTIARRLRPEALDELGLRSALVALGAAIAEQSGLELERSLDGDLDLSAEQELVIYRVAQEGLTNVVRHAHASRAELVLRRDGDGVALIVRDDGIGMAAEPEADLTGIRGMRERALLVGGELAIRPARPRGTELRLRLPSRGAV